jgi:hypothetical protein
MSYVEEYTLEERLEREYYRGVLDGMNKMQNPRGFDRRPTKTNRKEWDMSNFMKDLEQGLQDFRTYNYNPDQRPEFRSKTEDAHTLIRTAFTSLYRHTQELRGRLAEFDPYDQLLTGKDYRDGPPLHSIPKTHWYS